MLHTENSNELHEYRNAYRVLGDSPDVSQRQRQKLYALRACRR